MSAVRNEGKRTLTHSVLQNFEDLPYEYHKGKNDATIYTTIAALYAKICPQNRTDFYPHGLNSTPIIA